MKNNKNICKGSLKEPKHSYTSYLFSKTKQIPVVKISTNISTSQSFFSVFNFKEEVKNVMLKYHLIPSDFVAILGVFITLTGVYIFNFFEVTIFYLEHESYTLTGNIQFTQQFLEVWKIFGSSVSVPNELFLLIYQLKYFIITMTILTLIVVICIFINKKYSKIISSIATLILGILYLVFDIKFKDVNTLTSNPNNLIGSLFGIANIIIVIGLFLMLGGSYYTFYHFFKKCD